MKKMKITIGTGFYEPYSRIFEMENYQSYQEVVDKLIDTLEKEGCERFFGSQVEINNKELYDDEYVIGGNHCRILKHYGIFNIEEMI